jgi:hypothetical protein
MAEPFNWNVIVLGAWNPAILSPDGIRRRLFELPDNTPIELELAVDRPGVFRVASEGIVVVPTTASLEIAPRTPTAETLARACALGRRALQVLPETPVSAAGVNIRYRFDEMPDQVLDLVRAPLDATLSDAAFEVTAALTRRSLALPPGVINVQINHGTGVAGSIEFNFHRDATLPTELSNWLDRVQEFVQLADRISNILGVENVREIHA